MAPKTRQEEKTKTDKSRVVHFKPKLRQNGSSSSKKDAPTISSPIVNKQKNPESYESLVLFYLNKLRYLFSNAHPKPTARENSALKMDKMHKEGFSSSNQKPSSVMHPCKYTSSNPPKPREEEVESKIYKVVSAAIEYGFANNVIEKKGDCFYFKSKRPSLHSRAPTPGPQSTRYCGKCCNLHRCVKSSRQNDYFSDRDKPNQSLSDTLHDIHYSEMDRDYCRRISNTSLPRYGHSGYQYDNFRQRKPEESNVKGLKTILHCPECRALERLRK